MFATPSAFGRDALNGGLAAPSKGGGSLDALFAKGEAGFLFGPFSSLDQLLLLTSGWPGAIAADNDPVGLGLDRRAWGGASLSAVLAAQNERNPSSSWVGATTGVVGSGGSLPTGWSLNAATTTTINDITPDAQGNPALDITVSTTAAGSIVYPRFQLSSTIASVVGSLWRSTANIEIVSLVSGNVSTTNNEVRVATVEATGAGIYVNENAGSTVSALATPTMSTGYKRLNSNPNTRIQLSVPTAVEAGKTVTIRLKLSLVSLKLVPGNHAYQDTTTKRPLWRANSGKPYLSFDGADDFWQNTYIPEATGTLAVAFNSPTVDGYLLAGGTGTGNKRCRIGLGTGGNARFDFNTNNTVTSAADHRNTNVVLAMTWGGGLLRCYVDDALLSETSVAANMDGTGSPFTIGSLETGGSQFANARVFAALARSTFSSPSEISTIVSRFRSAYQ